MVCPLIFWINVLVIVCYVCMYWIHFTLVVFFTRYFDQLMRLDCSVLCCGFVGVGGNTSLYDALYRCSLISWPYIRLGIMGTFCPSDVDRTFGVVWDRCLSGESKPLVTASLYCMVID